MTRRAHHAGEEFVSEPIEPLKSSFDAQTMSHGLPGLPTGFTWRGDVRAVQHLLEHWKQSSREGGTADGELYLRRHYFRLQMSDGCEWVVYFIRQTPRSGPPQRRWFLYSRTQRPAADPPIEGGAGQT